MFAVRLPLSLRERNLIVLPLGGSAKYCETTVLNVLEQARSYLGWVCRF
ncbi:hypothetical protein [Pseudomonas sp. B329]|nr:hypothetical protein [Pseudomonas sp. B329]